MHTGRFLYSISIGEVWEPSGDNIKIYWDNIKLYYDI